MRFSVVIAALIAVLAAGWVLSGYLDRGEKPAAAVANAVPADENVEKLVDVRVRQVTSEPHSHFIVANGQTKASREVGLRAETEGRIVKILAREGDRVTAGQVIARIDMRSRKEQLAQAEAWTAQREMEYEAARQLKAKGFRANTTFAQTKAQLEEMRANLKAIKIDIGRTEIRAPFDGVLQTRQVELGDFLKIGDGVARIVDLDPILVVGYVSERDIGVIRRGQQIHARLVDGRVATGTISYVSQVADEQTRSYRIEAEIANPDHAIPDGMTTELRIPLPDSQAVHLSPAVLSLSDDGVLGVKTVDDNDRVVFSPVTIVDNAADGIWVTGIPDGARVITVGHEYVKAGNKVRPVEEDAADAS